MCCCSGQLGIMSLLHPSTTICVLQQTTLQSVCCNKQHHSLCARHSPYAWADAITTKPYACVLQYCPHPMLSRSVLSHQRRAAASSMYTSLASQPAQPARKVRGEEQPKPPKCTKKRSVSQKKRVRQTQETLRAFGTLTLTNIKHRHGKSAQQRCCEAATTVRRSPQLWLRQQQAETAAS